jgi:hypothetical protein
MGLEPETPCTLLLCGLSRSAFGASTGGRYKISGRRKICGLKPPRTSYASMIMDPTLEKHRGCIVRTSQFVPNLCPKYVRNIETYLTISNSIEIQDARKTASVQWNSLIFYILDFFAASFIR